MKTMKYFGMLVMGAIMAFGFTACGSDDDDNGGGGGGSRATTSVTINGTTFGVSNAYWNIETANQNDTFYELTLMNCNWPNVSDPLMSIGIIYHVKDGSTAQMLSGEFDDYQVAVSLVSQDETKDKSYIAYSKLDDNSGKLKVTISGNSVTVQVPALKYYNGFESSTTTYPGGAFSFTGSMSKLPETANFYSLD